MSIDPRNQSLSGLQGLSGPDGPGGPQQQGSAKAAQHDPEAGAAFRALLERLEEKTRALGAASESLDDPRALGDAVESARASVEEAVLLGSDLLEAYRAAQQRASGGPTTTQTDGENGGPNPGRGA
jgi:hypothetical protein